MKSKKETCADCNKKFKSTEGENICPECQKKYDELYREKNRIKSCRTK